MEKYEWADFISCAPPSFHRTFIAVQATKLRIDFTETRAGKVPS